MKRIAETQVMVKENNQNLIIETIIQNGQTSRAELAKLLKLSAPSVSNNITDLLEKNILMEIGEGDSIGGRKPIMLDFNYNYRYVIGIDLSTKNFKIALGNLKPEIIDFAVVKIVEFQSGKEVLTAIIKKIEMMIKKHNLDSNKLSEIVVGFPGVIGYNEDTFQMVPPWTESWNTINIKEEIQNKFNIRTVIVNDMNLAAVGECYYGIGKAQKNLMYISIDMGVGAGIVIDNKLYEGKRKAAGEIGYFVSSIEDLNPNNKYMERLETKVSVPSIINKIKNDFLQGKAMEISKLVEGDVSKIDMSIVENALKLNDSYTIDIFNNIANELAVALANISILLDLELIIIGGAIVQTSYDIVTRLNELAAQITPLEIKFMHSSLKKDIIIFGAFGIALKDVFNRILTI